jgi:phage tail sheath protein FI
MPVTPTYPGVYIEEIPSGVHTITGVSTSVTAFIGYTAKGPVNKAVRILNQGDYERNFGGLHRDSLVSYAVRQFFLNGGTNAWVVRVAAGAQAAAITLKDPSDNEVLSVYAVNEGDWGNYLRLNVDYNTSNPDSTFNLAATRFELRNGKLVPVENETFRNLSMSSRSSTYALNVVKSASKLIRLERAAGIVFADRGFSLGKDLSTFPALSGEQTNLAGLLDGMDPFTLVLTGAPPTDIDGLVTAMNTAIGAAGLSDRLHAERANAFGADAAAGNHVKLNSLEKAGNPNTADEFSSVTIVKAPANDLSDAVGMGMRNGGREKEGASTRRPAATGTFGGDLADRMAAAIAAGNVTVRVLDHSSGTAVQVLDDTVAFAGGTDIPSALDALQTAIRSIPNPATRNATVELNGTFARVVSSADTPNASIRLMDTPVDNSNLRLVDNQAFRNLQQYSVGTGVTGQAQSGAVAGSNGIPPGAAEIIGNYDNKTGIFAVRDVDIFNIMAIPDSTLLNDTEARSVIAKAISFCEQMRAFYIVDYDPTRDFTTIAPWVSKLGAQKNAAVFFPRIQAADPLDGFRLTDFPSSGTLSGLFARIDTERGVWKAPAGTQASLRGVLSLSVALTDQENGVLNQKGINCLRTMPAAGNVCWGARTLQGADTLSSEWKYLPVRRLALFLEESLFRGTQWVVFEPNDEPLWAQIRLNVGAFMHTLFRQGAFQGTTPREAYFVKCDKESTTQNDINQGIVNIVVGFAPLKPAEFVIIKIQQIAGQIET